MKIATKSNGQGRRVSITIWRGPGRGNRWQSRIYGCLTLDKYLDLHAWIGQTEPDPTTWIAENLPWLADMILLAERTDHKWVYGRYATVRPEGVRFTVSLDIHGGTRHIPGSHPTAESAIHHAQSLGARTVLCAMPGENSGNAIRSIGNSHGVIVTPQFSAFLRARPLSPP